MKKEIFTAVLISLLILGNAHAKTLGDFNNDGKLTIADVLGFVFILSGRTPASDVGQEYLLASECQGVQSDLAGDWEKPGTEDTDDGVTYYTEITTFHSNGTGWNFCLIDETPIYDHGWAMFTYSLAGNIITIKWVVEPHRYNAGNSFTGTYTVSGDTLTVYDEQGNYADMLTKRRL